MDRGGGRGDECLRSSAWEALDREHQVLLGLNQLLLIFMCCCEGYGFQAVYSGIGCINQRVWV